MFNPCKNCRFLQNKNGALFCLRHLKAANLPTGKTLNEYGPLLLDCKGMAKK